MGRFINKDPSEEQGGLNLYAFCLNNGVNRWDYLGMNSAWTSAWMQINEYDAIGWENLSADDQENYRRIQTEIGYMDAYEQAVNGYERSVNYVPAFAQQATISYAEATFLFGNGVRGGETISIGEYADGSSRILGVSGAGAASLAQTTTTAALNIAAEASYATEVYQRTIGGSPNIVASMAPNSGPTIGELSGAALAAQLARDGDMSRMLASNDKTPGYWDRYVQHVEAYAITPPEAVTAAMLGGGAVPKSWVPWTGGRGPALGSNNPLTSVPRAILGSNSFTTSAVARTGFAGLAIAGAAVGSYNFGVLLSGLVYAAFPGSNGLPPPPQPPPRT